MSGANDVLINVPEYIFRCSGKITGNCLFYIKIGVPVTFAYTNSCLEISFIFHY